MPGRPSSRRTAGSCAAASQGTQAAWPSRSTSTGWGSRVLRVAVPPGPCNGPRPGTAAAPPLCRQPPRSHRRPLRGHRLRGRRPWMQHGRWRSSGARGGRPHRGRPLPRRPRAVWPRSSPPVRNCSSRRRSRSKTAARRSGLRGPPAEQEAPLPPGSSSRGRRRRSAELSRERQPRPQPGGERRWAAEASPTWPRRWPWRAGPGTRPPRRHRRSSSRERSPRRAPHRGRTALAAGGEQSSPGPPRLSETQQRASGTAAAGAGAAGAGARRAARRRATRRRRGRRGGTALARGGARTAGHREWCSGPGRRRRPLDGPGSAASCGRPASRRGATPSRCEGGCRRGDRLLLRRQAGA